MSLQGSKRLREETEPNEDAEKMEISGSSDSNKSKSSTKSGNTGSRSDEYSPPLKMLRFYIRSKGKDEPLVPLFLKHESSFEDLKKAIIENIGESVGVDFEITFEAGNGAVVASLENDAMFEVCKFDARQYGHVIVDVTS